MEETKDIRRSCHTYTYPPLHLGVQKDLPAAFGIVERDAALARSRRLLCVLLRTYTSLLNLMITTQVLEMLCPNVVDWECTKVRCKICCCAAAKRIGADAEVWTLIRAFRPLHVRLTADMVRQMRLSENVK